MKLKELAEKELIEGNDFGFYKPATDWSFASTPITNNIFTRVISDYIVEEEFRCTDKTRYVMIKDGQEVPFATVERVEGPKTYHIFGGRKEEYKVKLAILPCMIPSALEALASHMQTCQLYQSNPNSVKKMGALLDEITEELMTLSKSALAKQDHTY